MKESRGRTVVDRIFMTGMLVVFGLIVLHAPLTVFAGTLLPGHALVIKAWKELVMGGLLVLAAVIVTRRHVWRVFLRDPVIVVGLALALIYMLSVRPEFGGRAYGAGLLIDLRYVLYAVLAYVAVRLYPDFRRPFLKVGLIGACVVVGFGILQFFLPRDFLTVFGYSKATIAPYTTIDDYDGLVRLQSTLRGPNPLGAYALIVVLVAAIAAIRLKITRDRRAGLVILSVLAAVLVFASYSRSAYLGLAAGIVVAGGLALGTRRMVTRRAGIIAVAVLIVIAGGLYAIRDTTFFASVLNHEVAGSGPAINSNEGHSESLATGWARVATHPFGYGTGSTGSASLLSDNAYIVENQYLFVAHEAGWGALVLFLAFIGLLLVAAYKKRADPAALGVFASGIGLLAVGLVLPVFADDTVSIVWFGLAGLIAGSGAPLPANLLKGGGRERRTAK